MTKKWLVPLLLILPYAPLLFWGANLADAAYAALAPLARLGVEAAAAAALLGTLGWGTAALLIWSLGRHLGRGQGAFVAALLFCFNPWIVETLGQATGWAVALIWLLPAALVRRRYAAALFGGLLLLSLFFLPAHGINWPAELAPPLLYSLLLFAAGMGTQWAAGALAARGVIAQDEARATTILLALLFVVFAFRQGNQLRESFAARPLAQWAVEEEAAAWLRANAAAHERLLSNERLAYLARLEAVATAPEALPSLLAADAPQYVIAGTSIPWQMLRESIPFRLYYEPLAHFGKRDAPQTELAIWGYRPPRPELGALEALNARVPDRLAILGYQIAPRPAAAGEPLTLALTLQRAAAGLLEAGPLDVTARLVSAPDGRLAAEWTETLPMTGPSGAWGPGEVLVEKLALPLPGELESGAYHLNLSLSGVGESALWPFSFNNDVNRLDRIPLGYVVVPWRGEMAGAQPLAARFEQGIELAAVDVGGAAAGEPLAVTLFWQSGAPVAEAYSVFVHLLDGDGQLAANQDGPPDNGRFPTDSWLPGMTVADTHLLALPQEMARGVYELRAGLYDAQSGRRLALSTLGGAAVEGDSVSLGTITLE